MDFSHDEIFHGLRWLRRDEATTRRGAGGCRRLVHQKQGRRRHRPCKAGGRRVRIKRPACRGVVVVVDDAVAAFCPLLDRWRSQRRRRRLGPGHSSSPGTAGWNRSYQYEGWLQSKEESVWVPWLVVQYTSRKKGRIIYDQVVLRHRWPSLSCLSWRRWMN